MFYIRYTVFGFEFLIIVLTTNFSFLFVSSRCAYYRVFFLNKIWYFDDLRISCIEIYLTLHSKELLNSSRIGYGSPKGRGEFRLGYMEDAVRRKH